MRLFKGRSKYKKYEPSKPTKWGIKFYAMVDALGVIIQFYRHREGEHIILKELFLI